MAFLYFPLPDIGYFSVRVNARPLHPSQDKVQQRLQWEARKGIDEDILRGARIVTIGEVVIAKDGKGDGGTFSRSDVSAEAACTR